MKDRACKTKRWFLLKQQLNNLPPAAFRAKMEGAPDAVLIDVRTDQERQQGQIPGSNHYDYLAYDFWDRMEQLDPEGLYLVYCRSGRRSIRACTLMKNGGFKHVYNLDGGFIEWEAKYGKEEVLES